eukprot:TRINITY_DN105051_c0_g1_i1.p1 TRINITY_DN105051_c0_g1~~TRINITY_DN105051_c0_g1_i1.p1  ORF type:complete len:342 (-),score=26.78 TRINITY_DN105051_c0_g1_i1:514-1437(-)
MEQAIEKSLMLEASIIIDGAYLMVGATKEHPEIASFFATEEGVNKFVDAISRALAVEIQLLPAKDLPPTLAKKLRAADLIKIRFSTRHFLCAYVLRDNRRYYPEKVNPAAWKSFNFEQNLHTYKTKTVKCPRCSKEIHTKVQSGVDVGVATKLCEELVYNGGNIGKSQSDIVVLVAGDNDFKDIMALCMNLKGNLFLLGFAESAHVISQRKYCLKFFDILSLLKAGQEQILSLSSTSPSTDYLLKIKVLEKGVQATAFQEFLEALGISPKSIDWDLKVLRYETKTDAYNALNCVLFPLTLRIVTRRI